MIKGGVGFWCRGVIRFALCNGYHTPDQDSQCTGLFRSFYNGTPCIQEVKEVSANVDQTAWDAMIQRLFGYMFRNVCIEFALLPCGRCNTLHAIPCIFCNRNGQTPWDASIIVSVRALDLSHINWAKVTSTRWQGGLEASRFNGRKSLQYVKITMAQLQEEDAS